jgi:hypothetical protein
MASKVFQPVTAASDDYQIVLIAGETISERRADPG